MVGLVSSVALFWPGALRGMLPTTRLGFRLARWAPWLLTLLARRTASRPDEFLARLREQLPECDRRVLARPEVAEVSAGSAAEALSTDEMGREMVLLRRDWQFAPSDVAVPTALWHGELDRNVPVTHGHRLAAALRDCRATFITDAGHYLVFDHWHAILSAMTADRF
ncbi:MAG TPA: alpha/beta hydrolase [Dongiaceae bacterium]|jgi:pimeloyl-ACP methyl ester carboxylesterase|nr:alpha/beta hydrolase [Dongiaceae bacterium]